MRMRFSDNKDCFFIKFGKDDYNLAAGLLQHVVTTDERSLNNLIAYISMLQELFAETQPPTPNPPKLEVIPGGKKDE